jgi:hypothetical protein
MYNNSSTNNLNTTYFGVAWEYVFWLQLVKKEEKNPNVFPTKRKIEI